MVNNVINGTYTETYDMRTVVGRMAILGIHTPTALSLKRMFRGYFEQYRKVKVHGCDLVGVCASSQQLTPAEVGLTAGLTDPRDVLNPILFKACTGESLNILLDRVYANSADSAEASHVDSGSITKSETSRTIDLDAYYTMLADDSFRKFHPQGGVRVGNLKPFVHRVVTTQPFKWSVGPRVNGSNGLGNTSVPVIGGNDGKYATGFGGPNGTPNGTPSVFVSNGLEPMPWLETTYETAIESDLGSDGSAYANVLATNIPKCFCGVLVLPPSYLVPLYFRFSIRWHISFKDFRPAYEIGSIEQVSPSSNLDPDDVQGLGMTNGNLYYNLYNTSSKLDNQYGSFDVNGSESVDLVNEKVA